MKRAVIALLAAAAVVAVIVVRIGSRQEQEPVQGIEEIQAERGIPVDVVTIREDTLVVTRALSGQTYGRRQTNLTSDFTRTVERVFVREGDRVSQGDPLLRFDTRHSPDQMARLAQLEEAYANAERQLGRLEPLLQKGAISESDLDDARTQLAVAEANLRDARLLVELVAPIDGVVTLVMVASGDVVEGGEAVVQIATLDSVRVLASVSADASREIRPGAQAWVSAGGEGQSAATEPVTMRGRVSRVALGADPESGLYEIEAVLENDRRLLRPGEYVRLQVMTVQLQNALIVPRAALLGEEDLVPGGEEAVYRVREGAAEHRRIRLGAVTEEQVQVVEGLEANDAVVVFGANRLRDGASVRLHEIDGVRVKEEPPTATPSPTPAGNASPEENER
jgi:RND family efflux transporter MFP subunit